MKLIHVKQARSVWLFDVQDLNPKGKDFTEDLIEWIKDAYSFIVSPDSKDVIAKSGTSDASGLIFKRGRFQAREDSFIEIASLAIHNDGIVVDTVSSTEESDRFASDLLDSASKEFGLAYDPAMIRKRLYVSTLIVRLEATTSGLHPALSSFAKRISEVAGGDHAPQFQLATLGFWTEPNDNGTHLTFTLAPQAGKSLTERRYFSEAPVKTEDHIRLLEELEQILAKV